MRTVAAGAIPPRIKAKVTNGRRGGLSNTELDMMSPGEGPRVKGASISLQTENRRESPAVMRRFHQVSC